MTSFLALQLIGWLIITVGSAGLVYQALDFQRRKKRLPQACHWDDLAVRLAHRQARVDELDRKSAQLSAELQSLEAQRADGLKQQAEAQAAREWMQETKESLLSLNAEREQQESLRKQLSFTRDELSTLIGDLSVRQNELAAVQLQQEKDRIIAEGLRDTLSQLHLRQSQLTAEVATKEARLLELKDLENWVAKTKSELEGAEGRLADVERELALRRDETETTRIRSHELQSELGRIESAIATTKAAHDGATQLLQQQQNNLALLTRDLTEKEAIAAELEGVESRLALANADLDAKVGKLDELTAEVHRRREEFDQLTIDVARARNEVKTREVEKEALLKQIDGLKVSLQEARKDFDKAAAALGKATETERYRDLWEPLPFPNLKSRAPGNEDAALTQTNKYFNELGLRFPQRTLHAFHTALKCADISPVTVLAGISGTGKSELPKRYAEAMGVHFVGLPVQPRWDSPTDLFGFFNHLEGRFKATELARAMVQFEKHNRSQWKLPEGWNHGREDKMLLVLLDEMNLARVEYYFSDFLSRLETRRGVDTANAADRAKAELALDMGSLGEGESPIRFFPDRNILFTGTMNEDESTQALSDKVLDRACVLRFGRPKKLAPARSNPTGSASTTALTTQEWQNWINDAKLTAQLDTQIGELNDAMEAMGKPFGHRVGQAIATYAAHYPSWIPNRLNLALADQIEQRILPKLRGMDTSPIEKPLQKIEKVIKSTNDDVLLSAFQAGRADSSFLWRGVDRD